MSNKCCIATLIVLSLCSFAQARTAGLIVESSTQLMGFEPQMQARLETLGYDVTIIVGDDVKDGNFTVEEAEAFDVIVVSESISSSDVTSLADANVPMMNGEGYGWHKMNYAESDSSASWQDANDLVNVVNDTHPIVVDANLIQGTVEFLMDDLAVTTTASVSSLASGAENLVSMTIGDIEYTLIFAIDKGAELAKGAGPAVNRIVGFSLPGNDDVNNVLSDYGWALFDAAIRWLDPVLPVSDGLVLYLDAGKIEGVADGNSVSVWKDLSGAGNDANQPSVDNQPMYVAASEAFAGQPAVRFNGESSWMPLNNDMVSVGSFTAFAVAQYPDLDLGHSQYILAAQDGSGNDRMRFMLETAVTPTSFGWRVGNTGWTAMVIEADTQTHVFALTSVAEAFLDGVSMAAATNTADENPDALNIGSYNRGQKDFFGGDLAILVIYDRVLSAEEITEMTTYLMEQALSGE